MRACCYLLLVLVSHAPGFAPAQTETEAMPEPRIEEAIALMNAFAERTGLTSGRPPRRYLWTDAFAVCNYLGLARRTGEQEYTERALQLVEQVHHTLGRHRDDDPRTGWISGLSAAAGERHPTQGGLRIGKTLPERGPDEPYDERLEWDRDGQYFHYLTRWMHALDQVARATGEARFNSWARELSRAAFTGFTYRPTLQPEPRRMHWKMSIDLGRALIPSMGQHDPLDGYVTNLQLQSTGSSLPSAGSPALDAETRVYAGMMQPGEWATADPLGLGSLLVDAWHLQQLGEQGTITDPRLPARLLEAALTGLRHYARSGATHQPAAYRLAFRELGLTIGLHAVERMQQAAGEAPPDTGDPRLHGQLRALLQFIPLRDEIEAFWRDPEHRRTETWSEHQDINDVMLATSLAPHGYLELLPPD
ncbi:MAG: hypothetical protein PVJ66_02250 [Gammaproteobacteria bacterium]|jgi:hypothetical protein